MRVAFTNYHLLLQPGIDLQVQEVTSFAFVNQSKSNEERASSLRRAVDPFDAMLFSFDLVNEFF